MYKSLVKNPPFCSFWPDKTHPLSSPSLSERGGMACPAMNYPLSRIKRGTRGELRKAMKMNQH
jgi:hypothetical protein